MATYAFPSGGKSARGATSTSLNGTLVVPDWRRPSIAEYNPTSNAVTIADLSGQAVSNSVNADVQLSGFLDYIDVIAANDSNIPYLQWLPGIGYYTSIPLDNSESPDYGQFTLPDQDIIPIEYPYYYPYFGVFPHPQLVLPATLPAQMVYVSLPEYMGYYSEFPLNNTAISGYSTAALSNDTIAGYSTATLAEPFTYESGFAAQSLNTYAYFEDSYNFNVSDEGTDSVSIDSIYTGWLSTTASQETGYVGSANDGNTIWAVGYGEGLLQYDGTNANQWALPFGETFCGVVMASGAPYLLNTQGTLYTINDEMTTQVSGALDTYPSTLPVNFTEMIPYNSVQILNGTIYALSPNGQSIIPYELETSLAGASQTPITVPMGNPYTLSTGASGGSGLLGVVGTDYYALDIEADGLAYLALLDQVFVAQSSANEIQVLQKNAQDLWAITQTVAGSGSPSHVAATTTAEQILVSNPENNVVQIIPETDGVWGSGSVQALSIIGPGQIALSIDNSIAFVCQPQGGQITLLQNNTETWSVSGSLSVPSPNRVLVTSSDTAYCAAGSGIANLIQQNGSWQVSGSIVTGFPVNDVAVDTLGGVYAASTSAAYNELPMQDGTYLPVAGFSSDLEFSTAPLTNEGTYSVSNPFSNSAATYGSLSVYFSGVYVGGLSWNGSADRVIWYEGQIAVVDSLNSVIRTFGLISGQYVQINVIPSVSGISTLVQTSDSWLFGGSAIWQYEWSQPYMLSRTESAIASIYNLGTLSWNSVILGRNQRAFSTTFDSTGNLWVSTDANQLYTISPNGSIVSNNSIPVYPKQLQTTPLGISSLTWMDGTLYGSSCLNDAIAVGL